MKLLLRPTTAVFNSIRGAAAGDLFIGANVQLRKELASQQLGGVKVAVLHGNGGRAMLISKILQDHGAHVEHFSLKGEKAPKLEKLRELDEKEDKSYLENVLRKTDVFVDGAGCEKFGLRPTELAKKNAKLIVAAVDSGEPFGAMNTMKAICIGLWLREKHQSGQVVATLDSKKYEETLRSFGQKQQN